MNANPKFTSFHDIKLGDELLPLTIAETQETIDSARGILPDDDDHRYPNIHNDPDFAKEGLFGGTVNGGPTTMAYIVQMLEQSFSLERFYGGGRLNFKGIKPFRPGDTVTFTGKVTEKQDDKKIVRCEIKGTNQADTLMGIAEAELTFAE